MSSRRSFVRKIIYLLAIGVLLIPLHWLSHPATNAAKGVQGNPGGKLARLRNEYHLSQAQLGEIDPTSVTIKLATLGMRGVAANILWSKATDYKMMKDWTNFGATLNQITKVQPNFLNVWVNQAWNLSYNVSVEFDDYRERYRWVIKGFKFLNDGIKYNEGQPKLPWELGRYVSQKIGKADEVKQFRRLFAKDSDYRESLPADLHDTCLDYKGQPDNWLVGKGWYEKAINLVDSSDRKGTIGQSPLIYYSSAPMCQMNYAEAIEKDGTFGEAAKGTWVTAANDWSKDESSFGNKPIPTSFRQKDSDKPVMIRLNDQETEEAKAKEAIAQLDKIEPGLREKMIAEKKANLPPSQRQALDTLPEKRTGKQISLAAQAEEAIRVAHDEVARKISDPKRKDDAKRFAREAIEHQQLASQISSSRGIVNFVYWRRLAASEQEDSVLDARQLIKKGDRAFANGDLPAAGENYRLGLKAWRKVLDAHPEYVAEQTSCEDLVDMIKRYRYILSRREESLPEPFILQDVIDSYQRQTGESPLPITTKTDGKKQESKPQVKKADAKKPEIKKIGVEKTKKQGGP